jgi:tetratricopeptide (TPR) repeat protein
LLGEEILKGSMAFFPRYIDKTVEHSPFGSPSWLYAIAKFVVGKAYLRPLAGSLQPEDAAVFFGIKDALQMDDKTMEKVISTPDLLQFLAAKNFGHKKDYWRKPLLGCTSFMASGKATSNGHALMGHNKDYDGMGYWDPYHTLIGCEPNDGYRYIIFASAGIHSASLGAMNEHGLSFTCHTILTKDVSPKAMPLIAIGRRVLQYAKDTDEALVILKKIHSQVGWKHIIMDKHGKGAVIEMSANHNHIYFMKDGSWGCGNLNENPEAIKDELDVNPSMMNNFVARQSRMKELLREHSGKIDPKLGVDMLGDHYDYLNKSTRSTGNVITQITNVMSFITDSTDKTFWMASGLAPACNTVYRGFHFEVGFDENLAADVPDIESPHNNSDMYQGLRNYVLATDKHFLDGDFHSAIEYLNKAISCDPNEIYYYQVAGIVCLQIGKYKEGEEYLRKSVNLKCTNYKKALAWLWIGRSLDLQAQRSSAISAYQHVLSISNIDPRMTKAAQKALKHPYKKSKLKNLALNFWLGDVVE